LLTRAINFPSSQGPFICLAHGGQTNFTRPWTNFTTPWTINRSKHIVPLSSYLSYGITTSQIYKQPQPQPHYNKPIMSNPEH